MKIEYALPVYGLKGSRTVSISPEPTEYARPPRITCLLALAHKFEALIRSGEVKDYAELARVGRVSRARVSQILKLLTLAPSIQERILELPPRVGGKECITERDLRKVVSEPCWDRQQLHFRKLVGGDAWSSRTSTDQQNSLAFVVDRSDE
jgi:hypothetical protein